MFFGCVGVFRVYVGDCIVLPRDFERLRRLAECGRVFTGVVWVKFEVGYLNYRVIRVLRKVRGFYAILIPWSIWSRRMTKTALSKYERENRVLVKDDGVQAPIYISEPGQTPIPIIIEKTVEK